jgi:hypothetical protein
LHRVFPSLDDCGQIVHLPVEHRLTALLQVFSLLAYVVRDLMGLVASLRHRIFHGIHGVGCLLAQLYGFAD